MTRDQQTAAIRDACIKANPEILYSLCSAHGGANMGVPGCKACQAKMPRHIRLADVLLAIGGDYGVDGDGYLLRYVRVRTTGNEYWTSANQSWDLRKDSLDDQEDETIAFVYQLLA